MLETLSGNRFFYCELWSIMPLQVRAMVHAGRSAELGEGALDWLWLQAAAESALAFKLQYPDSQIVH